MPDTLEKVYEIGPDGMLIWLAFKQKYFTTLANTRQDLKEMVKNVGGDPATFKNRVGMAQYIIMREQPLGVVQPADLNEMYSLKTSLELRPSSRCEWFEGHWSKGNGFLVKKSTMAIVTWWDQCRGL